MTLVFCESCQHLYNAAFDADLLAYSPEYENSLHFSAHFQRYAEALAQRLIASYQLEGKTVLELGCGSGDFLKSLCPNPKTRGFGFDASYPGDEVAHPPANVTIRAEFFGPAHAALTPDLVCSRHVLEHISTPRPWLTGIRDCLKDGTQVYIEVPNSLYTLRDGGIWDLIYEHCGYYSPQSLRHVLEHTGFAIKGIEESFEGQFISAFAECGPSKPAVDGAALPDAAAYVDGFQTTYEGKVAEWQGRLQGLEAAGKRVVIWGAGSKGNTFLNVMARGSQVSYAVDLNHRKHGMFVAGTGQSIVGPEFLREYRPHAVVVMNPVYLEEIRTMGQGLGLSAEYFVA